MTDIVDASCCDEWVDDPVLAWCHYLHAHGECPPVVPSRVYRVVLSLFGWYAFVRLLWLRPDD